MLAIGIDPGTAICGFGLVEMIGNRLRPVHYGAVFTDKNMLPEMRLKKIYDGLTPTAGCLLWNLRRYRLNRPL